MNKQKIISVLIATMLLTGVLGVSHDKFTKNNKQTIEKNIVLLENQNGNWTQNSQGDWSYIKNGQVSKGWQFINGCWYYLNQQGIMQTGWQFINNKWYYMNSTGSMQTGWIDVNNNWYCMNSNGAMETGWQFINDKWYYMNSTGSMQTGWIDVNNNWYCMNSDGAMETGWQFINNNWYYMNSTGSMQTGWIDVNNNWYCMNSNGAMETGWQFINNNWYYMSNEGIMETGFEKINNQTYYFDKNGVMQTGFVFLKNGNTYYFNQDGTMETNQVTVDGSTYYFTQNGRVIGVITDPPVNDPAKPSIPADEQYGFNSINNINNYYTFMGGMIDNQPVQVLIMNYKNLQYNNEGQECINTKIVYENDLNKMYNLNIVQEGNQVKFTVYNDNGTIKKQFYTEINFLYNGEYNTPTILQQQIEYQRGYFNDVNQKNTYLIGTNFIPQGNMLGISGIRYTGTLGNGEKINLSSNPLAQSKAYATQLAGYSPYVSAIISNNPNLTLTGTYTETSPSTPFNPDNAYDVIYLNNGKQKIGKLTFTGQTNYFNNLTGTYLDYQTGKTSKFNLEADSI